MRRERSATSIALHVEREDMNSHVTGASQRADIQGLRAIAVLAVILQHTIAKALPGGFAGVDVFFVISGYLIGGGILDQVHAGRFSLLGFYGRRARRIFPALIVVLAATWAAGWMVMTSTEFISLGRHIASSSVFANNVLLWWESGYFDAPSAMKPLLHLWSLGVEEQFYLIVPLLILACGPRAAGTVVLRIALVSLVAMLVIADRQRSFAFYMLPTRFWELAVGVLVACGQRNDGALSWAQLALNARWRNSTGILALAALGVAFVLSDSTSWPSVQVLIPVAATAALIAAPTPLSTGLLGWRPLVAVGNISYPLYLWHWPLLVYWRMLRPGEDGAGLFVPIVAAVILAWLTYAFIEQPVRFGRLAVPRVPIAGAGVLLGLGLVGGATAASDGFPLRFAPDLRELASYTPVNPERSWRLQECYRHMEDDRPFLAKCTVPAPAKHTVLLWGDSHAAHLYPGLSERAAREGFVMWQWTAASCPPGLRPFRGEGQKCARVREQSLAVLAKQVPDTVVLGGAWRRYEDHGMSPEQIGRSLAELAADLRRRGVQRVIVVGPGPVWPQTLPTELYRTAVWRHLRAMPDRLSGTNPGLLELDGHLRAATSGIAAYVSLLDMLCTSGGCEVAAQGTQPDQLLFFDEDHLSVLGSRRVANSLPPLIAPSAAGG
jgi:peptidoglycan/LPS O-acetylase OafA/YrhL